MYWKTFAALAVALGLLPSLAQAANSPELTYPTGTRLGLEAEVRAVSVGEPKLTSESSTLTCKSTTLAGKTKKNNGTEVEAEIESATFSGGCSGFSINTKPATNGVPWCLRSTPELAEDEGQIRGGACGKTIQPIRFDTERTTTTWQECAYERSAVIKGSYKTYSEDAVLTSNEVEYVKVSGPFFCIASTKLDTSITLEKDEATTNPLYISAGPLLTGSPGVILPIESKVRGRNSGPIKVTTSLGSSECSAAEITGTLRKNNGTEIEADIESASFSGTGTGGACTDPLFPGDVTWTFKPATNGLPWCLKANSKLVADEFQIRGNNCSSASRPIRFIAEVPSTTTDVCHYERAAALTGTFTTHPEDAQLELKGATFLEVEPKSGSCPDETTLDSTLTFEKNEAGTHPMYID